MYATLIKYLV